MEKINVQLTAEQLNLIIILLNGTWMEQKLMLDADDNLPASEQGISGPAYAAALELIEQSHLAAIYLMGIRKSIIR